METWTYIAILVMCLFIASLIVLSSSSMKARRASVYFSLIALVGSVSVFGLLKGENPQVVEETQGLTRTSFMDDIQTQLKDDPNNAELWFQLGHGYLLNDEVRSALTCFDYAIRLSPSPSASQFAAKATALYYLQSQRISPEIRQLLEQSIALEPNNLTALTLIANDHFLSFRYQDAIDTWVQMLDSQQSGLNRVSVTDSINQARELMGK